MHVSGTEFQDHSHTSQVSAPELHPQFILLVAGEHFTQFLFIAVISDTLFAFHRVSIIHVKDNMMLSNNHTQLAEML